MPSAELGRFPKWVQILLKPYSFFADRREKAELVKSQLEYEQRHRRSAE